MFFGDVGGLTALVGRVQQAGTGLEQQRQRAASIVGQLVAGVSGPEAAACGALAGRWDSTNEALSSLVNAADGVAPAVARLGSRLETASGKWARGVDLAYQAGALVQEGPGWVNVTTAIGGGDHANDARVAEQMLQEALDEANGAWTAVERQLSGLHLAPLGDLADGAGGVGVPDSGNALVDDELRRLVPPILSALDAVSATR